MRGILWRLDSWDFAFADSAGDGADKAAGGPLEKQIALASASSATNNSSPLPGGLGLALMPGGGALARAARAHAACVFAHCARHVDARAAPAWLETRARNVLRGDVAETFANARTALDAALDACLFEADETATESPDPFVDNGEDERALSAALSSLPNELVASVRAAALALAEDAASDEKGEKSRGSFEVSARARRAMVSFSSGWRPQFDNVELDTKNKADETRSAIRRHRVTRGGRSERRRLENG